MGLLSLSGAILLFFCFDGRMRRMGGPKGEEADSEKWAKGRQEQLERTPLELAVPSEGFLLLEEHLFHSIRPNAAMQTAKQRTRNTFRLRCHHGMLCGALLLHRLYPLFDGAWSALHNERFRLDWPANGMTKKCSNQKWL